MNELVRPLSRFTPARIGLASSGSSLRTCEALRLSQDHALARDAVHAVLDPESMAHELARCGHPHAQVRSQAIDRDTYLRRPDLGRRLHPGDGAVLAPLAGAAVVVVVADGLAPQAPARHALPLLQALAELLPNRWRNVTVVVASQGRVALGDEVGELLGARVVLVLLGERPGMSAPDSLGAYLTHAPRRGRTDAERNCVSNIRPDGLGYVAAARTIAWLVEESLARGYSGLTLKDDSAGTPLRINAAPANIRP